MCDDTGVRIGVLCPGMVLTDMTEDMKQREKDRTYRYREEEHIRLAAGWTPYVYKALTRVGISVPAWNVSLWLLWRVRCD